MYGFPIDPQWFVNETTALQLVTKKYTKIIIQPLYNCLIKKVFSIIKLIFKKRNVWQLHFNCMHSYVLFYRPVYNKSEIILMADNT